MIKEVNAMNGGSHESFDFLANIAVGAGHLMASFTGSLQRFREGAMPRILENPVTFEEVEHPKHSNLAFGEVDNLGSCWPMMGCLKSMVLRIWTTW